MDRCALLLLWFASLALSSSLASAVDAEPKSRQLTQEEIDAWLDASSVSLERDVKVRQSLPEAPPPAPRKHGWVIEGSVGGVGHLGTLKHVSPASPEFRLMFGYEVIDPLMLFADAGMFLSSTRYAVRPPDPRTYAYYCVGGGLRVTFEFWEWLGGYVQGSAGMASATEDVLLVYGYRDSNEPNLYFGGQAGFEWLQVSPHYTLAASAGLRNYVGLERERSDAAPLVINAGVAIKYTF
jgi:hypothetical protein